MVNDTVRRFGYPQSLVHEYDGWVVLLRNDQITVGSLVLAVKSEATSLSGVAAETLAELGSVSGDIERALAATFAPDKLNYLMLMMVDPHVHFTSCRVTPSRVRLRASASSTGPGQDRPCSPMLPAQTTHSAKQS